MKVLLLIATALPFIAGQVDMPGGPHTFTTNLSDPNVVFALKTINEVYRTNGDQRPRVGEKIVSATSQVVAGVKYTYKIEVKVGDDVKELCAISVWSRPWLTGTDALSVLGTPECHPETIAAARSVGVVGGQEDVSFSDPDVQKVVHFLESKLNAKSNSLFYLKATSASKVTKQVVNGIIYRFYVITYAESVCTQEDVKKDTNKLCTVNANSPVRELCTDEVYYSALRETPYSITSETCQLPVIPV
ncbi:hypothetical protein BsWGS_10492 [Bradybaena similaris]